ncbi:MULTISPECIES: phosphotransferase family protein [unclassified Paenibacillus]|uniref:phosphotransferase family protein n=1 Tax=unclassified Paenibacillus TaxID=185978 RepID=UPI000FE1D733|nr:MULTISPECIES: aminoglycoside phosphotransferase family protein [unclassified Paenibacillus]MCM3172398.1 phosphotransferase [Paenibacillus sp. MER 99-2]
MNSKLGVKLGEGGCAEVYAWEGESKIIKLAKPNTIIEALQAELHHSYIAWACGLAVPQPFDMQEVEERWGIVFERVYGDSIMKRFVDTTQERARHKQLLHVSEDYLHARVTAQMLYQIHSHAVPNMPSQRDNIKHDIQRAQYLSEAEKARVIELMDQIPTKQQLCHGDPNPGNIILRENDAIMIDWNNASVGNPEADLAEYILMIQYAILPVNVPQQAQEALEATREESIRMFIEHYGKLSGIRDTDIEPWFVVVAARKLAADGISEEEKGLLVQEIRRRLHSTPL